MMMSKSEGRREVGDEELAPLGGTGNPHTTIEEPLESIGGPRSVSTSGSAEAMSAIDYVGSSQHANWRKGSRTQRKILIPLTALSALGNLLLWLVGDFMGQSVSNHFASLMCCVLFILSTRSSIYRGTLRTFATLILHQSLHDNICSLVNYFTMSHTSLVSKDVAGLVAQPMQLLMIQVGASVATTATALALLVIYTDCTKFSKASVVQGVANGNGIVTILSGLFLASGCFITWAIQHVCSVVPTYNNTAPMITVLVMWWSVVGNDFEARDLAFFYLVSGLLKHIPFDDTDIKKSSPYYKSDMDDIYLIGQTLMYSGVVTFCLGNIFVALSRRGVKCISVKDNCFLVIGLTLNSLFAIAGAVMTWIRASSVPQTAVVAYIAGLVVAIALLQLIGTLASIHSLTLFNMVLVPIVVSLAYPRIFVYSGTERAAAMFLATTAVTSVFLPMVSNALEETSRLSEKSHTYIAAGIVLVISAWLGLTETDSSRSGGVAVPGASVAPTSFGDTPAPGGASFATTNAAKLELTAQTGYTGLLIALSYATRSEDGLKMAFYLVGNVFLNAWPWALGYNNTESTSTILSFFAIVIFSYRYLVDLGDGAFLSLTVPGEDPQKETPFQEAEVYEGSVVVNSAAAGARHESGLQGRQDTVPFREGAGGAPPSEPSADTTASDLGAPLIEQVVESSSAFHGEPEGVEEGVPRPRKGKARKN